MGSRSMARFSLVAARVVAVRATTVRAAGALLRQRSRKIVEKEARGLAAAVVAARPMVGSFRLY